MGALVWSVRVGKIYRAPCQPNSGLPELGTLRVAEIGDIRFRLQLGHRERFCPPYKIVVVYFLKKLSRMLQGSL